MSSNDEQDKIELKVSEEVVQKEEEQEEEEEEEQNEEEDKNQNQKEEQGEEKEDNNNNDEEDEGGAMEIKLVKEDEQDEDDNKKKLELELDPEIKINVEWYINANKQVDILFKTMSKRKLTLHWGVFRGNNHSNWCRIDKAYYPDFTLEFQDSALQTEFSLLEEDDLEKKIHISFPKDDISTFNFVFWEKDGNKWFNNGERDYHLDLN